MSLNDGSEPAISIKNVSVSYGKHKAVDNVGLTVQPGEIVALLGPNGAGKSSLLQSVIGITPMNGGDILLCGTSIAKKPVAAKRHLGAAAQPIFVYDFLTAEEHVAFVAQTRGVHERLAEKVLGEVGLARQAKKLCRELSYGMRQRVALASAVIGDPDIIVLDETLNGLDPRASIQARQALCRRSEDGAAIVLSTHVLGVLEQMISRIVIMDVGKVQADITGTALESLRKGGAEALEAFYLEHTRDVDTE